MRSLVDNLGATDRWRATRPVHVASPRHAVRLVIADDDPAMLQLLEDIFSPDFDVVPLRSPVQISDLAAAAPDVIFIGWLGCSAGSGLATAEVVELAGRHMALHEVPMVVLTAAEVALADAGRLAAHPALTLLSVPFDLETVRCVMESVRRPSARPALRRLPHLCAHGYDEDARCPDCG